MCTGLLASSMADLAFDFVSSREPARGRPWPLPSPDPPASCASAAVLGHPFCGAFCRRYPRERMVLLDSAVVVVAASPATGMSSIHLMTRRKGSLHHLVRTRWLTLFRESRVFGPRMAKQKGPPSHVANWRSIVSGTSDSVASTMRRESFVHLDIACEACKVLGCHLE